MGTITIVESLLLPKHHFQIVMVSGHEKYDYKSVIVIFEITKTGSHKRELMAIVTLLKHLKKKLSNNFFSYIDAAAVEGLTFIYLQMTIT